MAGADEEDRGVASVVERARRFLAGAGPEPPDADGENENENGDTVVDLLVDHLGESSADRRNTVDPSDLPDDVGDLGGVTEERAARLREADVGIEELRAFRVDRISEVDGISRGLAGRIKSVVGDRFDEREGVDPRPILDAADEETVWVDAAAFDGDRLDGDVTVGDGYVTVTDPRGDHYNVPVGPERALLVDATDGVPSRKAVESGSAVEHVDADEVDAGRAAVGLRFGQFRRLFADRIEEVHVAADWPNEGRVRVDGGWGIPTVEAEPDRSQRELAPSERDHVVSVKYPEGLDLFETGGDRLSVLTAVTDREESRERAAGDER